MFGNPINAGDIMAEVRNGYLLYFVPVDFTEDKDDIILHCKTEGYTDCNGGLKYGNKNIPISINAGGKVVLSNSFIVTDNYININFNDSRKLVELNKKTTDWPLTSRVKKAQKPFFDKWIKSLCRNLEHELKLVDSGQKYRYNEYTNFTTSHNGKTHVTRIKISRVSQSIKISFKSGKRKWSQTLASYVIDQSCEIHDGSFAVDDKQPLRHPLFLDTIKTFCKENGIKV